MIGIIDTESQNIGSLINCLNYLKIKSSLLKKPEETKRFKKIILPGVGSFDSVITSLKKKKFDETILKEILRTKEVLAICIGLQILFYKSEEGKHKGINIFEKKIKVKDLKNIGCKGPVPHVGFNSVILKNKKPNDIISNNDYYFTHSYALENNLNTINFDQIGLTTYGNIKFISYFVYKNIIATQFHPEKSGLTGLNFLKNFYVKKKNNI